MEDFSLKWQAPEYHHYQRGADWFWAVGIITISIVVLAFFFNNALFGVLILLSAIILITFVVRQPKIIDYEINVRGITINNELHPYLTLESFWTETRGGDPRIILKSKKIIMPMIIIPVHDDDVDDVNSILREFIEEKELHEPASHKIMDYLGF